MDDICGIYKVQNLINNKIYIGKSIHIYRRWEEHKNKAKKQQDESYFHKVLNTYGENNFSWEIIEVVPINQLNEREQYWIKFYDCLKPKGYNLTIGGDGGCPEFLKKPICQYSLEGEFIAKYESGQEAARANNILVSSGIYECCKGKYKSSNGYIWRYADDFSKIEPYKDNKGINRIKVEQYDCDGNYIASYDSIMEAAEAIGKINSQRSISRCCKGEKYKTVGGFQWKFAGSDKIIEKVKPPKSNSKKQVGQYNLDGNLIQIFSSSREASRETGIAQASISNTCLGKQKKGGGYLWKYL